MTHKLLAQELEHRNAYLCNSEMIFISYNKPEMFYDNFIELRRCNVKKVHIQQSASRAI